MACKDKKYFPADPDLNILTFLNDKKINGELYAYLQSISDFISKDNGQNRYTYVLKKKIPTQAKVCSLLGIKSPKTYRNHLKYLID
jgi:hypothetical protein